MNITSKILHYLGVKIDELEVGQFDSLLRPYVVQSIGSYSVRSNLIRAMVLVASEGSWHGEASVIPKRIVQFWDDGVPPDDVFKLSASWIGCNPGYEYQIYDDSMARDLIVKNFDKAVVSAFDLCGHPVLRSDLFRFCFLYVYGGVYTDIDEQCISSIEDLIKGQYLLGLSARASIFLPAGRRGVPVSEALRGSSSVRYGIYFNNSPLFAPSGSALTAFMIESIVFSIQEHSARGMQLRVHDISAPPLFNQRIMTWLSRGCMLEDRLNQIHISPDWYESRVTEPHLQYKRTERHWSKT